MEFLSYPLAIAGLLVLVLYLWRRVMSPGSPKMKGMLSPEPSGALPIIGHLHQLGGQTPFFRTLAAMADKYGPIFTIWLGKHRTLVINNYEAVKECFTQNDRVLANRPKSTHGKYLGYNYAAFGFASYGPFWRDMRKLVMVELFSSRRLETLKHVQVSEVDAFINGLYSICKLGKKQNGQKGTSPIKVVNISEWIEHMSLNIITRMIAGKRYFDGNEGEEEQRIGNIMKEFMFVSGSPVASDVIGFPEWVDFKGQVKSMKKIGRELDCLMESWVEEHCARKQSGRDDQSSNYQHDFIDVMMSINDDGDNSLLGHERKTLIKATAMNLIVAGSESTAISLTWALSLLLNNRKTLKEAQEELDLIVGKDRLVQDTDIKNLVYLQSIVKETLRLYPPAPVSVPHEAMEDCNVCGYHIPKCTRLFVNLFKLHRDPSFWPDPEVFSPKRFLTTHAGIDASGHHFEFIPFGSGRRSCPGMNLALQVIHLALARLLQGFELTTPLDLAVDMTEGLGITLPRATSLEVILHPRLPSEVYQQ